MFVIIGLIFVLYVLHRLYQQLFPSSDIDPRGKYVLISGCDTGFGHGLAIELDKQGFNVLAGIYNPDNQISLADCLSSRATVFCLDITRRADIDAAYEIVKDKTSTLHALVNNAGIIMPGFIDWISIESIRKTMDVNFFGHVAMTKKFLPLLIAKRDSRVVNVCSMAGFVTFRASMSYCASKYALESFSDCLRREMSAWSLRVSIIEPGPMQTPLSEGQNRLLSDLWIGLSSDVKERWGEDFTRNELEQLNNALIKHNENPQKVVQALRHAVTNTVPRIRYRPGWMSNIFFVLSMLPAWMIDRLLAMNSILPADVYKQPKE
ncbi:unnamed protein product [Didymodactylos carnosus]|uniref:Uncharacterized protein n=1 Tax=Didymodactylos carnosus TaxID=1234261 RepID=A0A815ZIS6_9BILA|nr:unnamed protein product [Didymodactylos carnosus]CAF4453648.1 unnamed protein product [Didymodactylos carnosus]